jgi:hypothetical protein
MLNLRRFDLRSSQRSFIVLTLLVVSKIFAVFEGARLQPCHNNPPQIRLQPLRYAFPAAHFTHLFPQGNRVVEILLATFNGERFLRQQIDSLLAQDANILARDDGSRDATPQILADYATQYPTRFRILEGPPTGNAKDNFLELIRHATADYICFADQDDIWLSNKVQQCLAAIKSLEATTGSQTPLLAFHDLRVVDESLTTIHESMWSFSGIHPDDANHLPRLLGRSIVTGCAAMINRPMLELARHMPEEAAMHDRWIALLAASMGRAAILREQLVLYRQHQSNVIGAVATDDSLSGTIHRAQSNQGRREERIRCEQMAEALLRLHATEMPAANADILRAYLRSGRSNSAIERLATTLRYGFYRAGLMRNLAMLADLARQRTDA